MTENNDRKAWQALATSLGGVFLLETLILGFFNSVGVPGEFQFYVILPLGVALVFCGLIDLGFYMGMRELIRNFKSSSKALGWQLAVFVAGIIAFPVAWFISSWPFELTYNATSGIYTFTGVSAQAINFARVLIGVAVGICLFSLIIWLWVNSNRKGQVYG